MDDKLIGALSGKSEITGTLSGTSEITGTLSGTSVLSGVLTIPEKMGDTYHGSYDITPTNGFQLLPTQDCFMNDDIIVNPVPYQEVANEHGGYTLTIGE